MNNNYHVAYIPQCGYFIAHLPLQSRFTKYGKPTLTRKNDEPAIIYTIDPEWPRQVEYLLSPQVIGWPIYKHLGFEIEWIAYDQAKDENIFVVEDSFDLQLVFRDAGAQIINSTQYVQPMLLTS